MDLDDNNDEDMSTTTSSSTGQRSSTVPEHEPSTSTEACDTAQRLPHVIDKTWAAAKEVDTASTPSSGTRARSRKVLRLLMGYPVKLQFGKNGGKCKKRENERPPTLSREERDSNVTHERMHLRLVKRMRQFLRLFLKAL